MTMKKVLAIAMATLLMAGMASCGGNTESSENTEATIPDYGQQIKDNKTIGREFMEQNERQERQRRSNQERPAVHGIKRRHRR